MLLNVYGDPKNGEPSLPPYSRARRETRARSIPPVQSTKTREIGAKAEPEKKVPE